MCLSIVFFSWACLDLVSRFLAKHLCTRTPRPGMGNDRVVFTCVFPLALICYTHYMEFYILSFSFLSFYLGFWGTGVISPFCRPPWGHFTRQVLSFVIYMLLFPLTMACSALYLLRSGRRMGTVALLRPRLEHDLNAQREPPRKAELPTLTPKQHSRSCPHGPRRFTLPTECFIA